MKFHKIYDRLGWLDKLNTGLIEIPVVLDLGCGHHKFLPTAIGIDNIDNPQVDIVGDVFEVLSEIPNSTVDCLYSAHFLSISMMFQGFCVSVFE